MAIFDNDLDQIIDSFGGTTVADAATLTVSKDSKHDRGTIVFDRAAGVTATLPPATGSGIEFTFVVGTTVTSNNDVIQVENSSDTFKGVIHTAQDGGDTSVAWEAAAASDTISLNGTTKGGIQGDYIKVIDIKTNVWLVLGFTQATGTEVTPFSAAV